MADIFVCCLYICNGMRCICPALKDVSEIVGRQKCNSQVTKIRASNFCVQYKVEAGLLYYNTFTKELLLINNEDDSSVVEKYLCENWFKVPESFDEVSFYNAFLSLYSVTKPKANGIKCYTIFTTTMCNARCFYCYEKGIRHSTMNVNIANKVVNYICKTHCREGRVNLNWFGGEPLCNSNVIDVVCDGLEKKKINYISNFTTNGYLFDRCLIDKAMRYWHLRDVQITLDGTKDVYNNVKAYVSSDSNPYERVINNIEALLNKNVNVAIRINIGIHNLHDVPKLVDELNQKFNGYDNICVYCESLFEDMGSSIIHRTPEQRKEILSFCNETNHKLQVLGMSKGNKLPKDVRWFHCMADNDSTIVIFPDGKLGKCDSRIEDGFVGHINDTSLDQEMLANYYKQREKLPECKSCFYYPECIRLEMCQSQKTCTEEFRESIIHRIKQAMLNEYNDFLKKK